MGTPDFAAGILKALLEAGYDVTGCVAQPDKPKGRKKTPVPCPVKETAEAAGIPVLTPVRVRRNPEALEWIREREPELIVVAAFGQILPKELLELPPLGCLNVHASLLPAYRGAAPIQHALLDGQEKTGVTIMKMDEGLDTGDMLAVSEVVISPEETGGSLFDKLMAEGAELLVRMLPDYAAGRITPVKQPSESTTAYAGMLKKEDGLIDFHESADVILRKIRALSPWPSAYTHLDGRTFKIWQAHRTSEDPFGPAGALRAENGTLCVVTGDGVIALDEVQMEGKKKMKTADFLRGYRIAAEAFGERNSN